MERLDVHVARSGGPGRCAWCHDDVRIEDRSACASCLAVHHPDCWRRDQHCAACGHTKLLIAKDTLAREGLSEHARAALATLEMRENAAETRAARFRVAALSIPFLAALLLFVRVVLWG